jgi:tetratricopeptide (TPR) repeat protein
VSGALNGNKGTGIFRKMLKQGVVSGDVLGMVGTYHYWTSVLVKNFYWLPFIEDRREQGITELTVALKNAKYLKFAIISSLLWIYYDHNRFADALDLCNEVLTAYPGNRIFLQVKMHILYKLKDYGSALELACALDKAYTKLEQVPVNETAMRIKRALVYYSMGRYGEGEALTAEIMSVPYSEYMKTRLKKEFEYLEQAKNGNRK